MWSRVAQRKRAGPITQRSKDRNLVLLFLLRCYKNGQILEFQKCNGKTLLSLLDKHDKFVVVLSSVYSTISKGCTVLSMVDSIDIIPIYILY